jgi:hypothetical protein
MKNCKILISIKFLGKIFKLVHFLASFCSHLLLWQEALRATFINKRKIFQFFPLPIASSSSEFSIRRREKSRASNFSSSLLIKFSANFHQITLFEAREEGKRRKRSRRNIWKIAFFMARASFALYKITTIKFRRSFSAGFIRPSSPLVLVER